MAKLYEINREIEDLIRDNFDSETGMLNPEIIDELNTLELERDQKLLAIGKFIKNLESEANEHTEEKKRQDHKAKVLQRKADRLREYIQWNLKGNELVRDSQVEIGLSGRPSLEIDDDLIKLQNFFDIPEKYINTSTVLKINKRALLEAIQDGSFEHPKVSIKYNLIIK